MANVSTIKGVLAAAVATGGTITVTYPTGTTRGDFLLGVRHRLSTMGKVFSCPETFTAVFGAASVVLTYQGATTIPAGQAFTVELDRNTTSNPLLTQPQAVDTFIKPGLFGGEFTLPVLLLSFGTPTTLSTTAVCAAQAIAGAVSAVINGTKAVAGVAPLGAPTGRAVQVVSSNAGDTTQVVTITGTDIYNQAMRQTLTLNGTTPVLGTKAFSTITAVAVSAATAGNLSVGDTDKLGFPVYLPNSVFILKEIQDGAVATAGTVVAGLGITSAATAANGDVRGTYTPNSATDGSRSCAVIAALPEPFFYGQPQF